MGIRIRRLPWYPGNDCIGCTDPLYNLFEPGKTPKYVWVYFWGIGWCSGQFPPPPQNIPLRLEQKPLSACSYYKVFYQGGFFWPVSLELYHLPGPVSILTLHQTLEFPLFLSHNIPCPPEYWIFENEFTSCSYTRFGKNGFAIISWHQKVTDIIDWMGLTPSEKLFLEEFPAPDDTVVSKFCDKTDGTNIKIKHST